MGELERMTRRYTSEIIEFLGPEKDVPAPGHEHQRADHGMDHGHLLDAHAADGDGVVTGKPLNIGGSRGRREATGRGICVVCDEALRYLNMQREGCRVIVQGFGNVGSNAAQLMMEKGYKIIGIAEIRRRAVQQQRHRHPPAARIHASATARSWASAARRRADSAELLMPTARF